MKNLNKFIVIFLTIFFLEGCTTISDGLSLKKKDKIDEFLVEKKNPLILPPDFEKLPIPRSLAEKEDDNKENDVNLNIANILKKKSNNNFKKNDSSVKESIMKKINKN